MKALKAFLDGDWSGSISVSGEPNQVNSFSCTMLPERLTYRLKTWESTEDFCFPLQIAERSGIFGVRGACEETMGGSVSVGASLGGPEGALQ